MLLAILLPLGCILTIIFIVCFFAGIFLDRQGLEVKKKVRRRKRTYDDGLGKYTVNIKDEEYVIVPKNNNE